MRPGAYSQAGFLGPHESLEAVIARDTHTLDILDISFEQIADTLEYILQSAVDQNDSLAHENRQELERRKKLIFGCFGEHFPNLVEPGTIPHFSVNHLPDVNLGYLVGKNLQVFYVQYRGFQPCPWGCAESDWGCYDFLVINRRSGLFFSAPGLIVHLIRGHHFFEGLKSPYRVSPTKAALTLGLLTRANPHRTRYK